MLDGLHGQSSSTTSMVSSFHRAGRRRSSVCSSRSQSGLSKEYFLCSLSALRFYTAKVKSRCGAVALGRTYLLPPLSSGGALVVQP